MGKKEIISSIVCMLIAIAVLTASLRLGIGPFHNPGPGFMGFCAGALLAVLSAALIATVLTEREKTAPLSDLWEDRDWHIPLIVVAALILYCLALPGLGYLSATFVLMAALFALNRINVGMALCGALLISVSTFILFDSLLKVPLPRGSFGF